MILHGDALEMLKTLETESVQCCVTSPPYFNLRDYGVPGQIGMEKTPREYISKIVNVFGELRRVLAHNGVAWLNIGDSYSGSWGNSVAEGSISAKAMDKSRKDKYGTFKPAMADRGGNGEIPPGKNLLGIPWRTALALQKRGWFLRSAIVWAKPNGMPGSQDDRPTASYEMIFMLSRSARYYSDFDAIKTPPPRINLNPIGAKHPGTSGKPSGEWRPEDQRTHETQSAIRQTAGALEATRWIQ